MAPPALTCSHRGDVKNPFHLATGDVSAVSSRDMPVLANLSSVKSVVDDVEKALRVHGISGLFHFAVFCLSHRCRDLGKINHFEFGPLNCITGQPQPAFPLRCSPVGSIGVQ